MRKPLPLSTKAWPVGPIILAIAMITSDCRGDSAIGMMSPFNPSVAALGRELAEAYTRSAHGGKIFLGKGFLADFGRFSDLNE